MAKKRKKAAGTITNRQARHDYVLEDSLIVGLELTGAEAKSLRLGHGQLRGAYVTIKNNELYLINANITGDSGIRITDTDKTRARKLLAKRKEIEALQAAKQQGRTIVPLEMLTRGKYIKLRISLGKGKKLYDKRHALKARDDARRAATEIKRTGY
ncbi:MAG TPA: SsrA-binding protein SmpB [Candidatus Saccharimonadales bacterium]|nr:SsrA-binding protein SmpB [Candidatus Saccharimonadales bacterium]